MTVPQAKVVLEDAWACQVRTKRWSLRHWRNLEGIARPVLGFEGTSDLKFGVNVRVLNLSKSEETGTMQAFP